MQVPKPKKISLNALKKKCHEAWRSYIFTRDRHACRWYERPVHEGCLDPHHIFHKSRYGVLRYDVRNGITLCRKCHSYIGFGGEREFEIFFQDNYPDEWAYLVGERKNIFKMSRVELEEKLMELEKLCEHQQGGEI